MIKIGQQYRADKSQIVVEIISDRMQRHPGAKPEWILKPFATEANGKPAPDFPIWKESFQEEVDKGNWTLSFDPDAPIEEVGPPRNRLDDIE